MPPAARPHLFNDYDQAIRRLLKRDPSALLERVRRQHPDDFWVNMELGELFRDRDPAVAIRHLWAAEALRPEFKTYAAQIVANAQALALSLKEAGFRIVSGGTDNHLMLVDVFEKGILGS